MASASGWPWPGPWPTGRGCCWPATSQAVFEALRVMVRETGVAALIATHNMELAGHMDRVFALKDGHLEERPAESHAY